MSDTVSSTTTINLPVESIYSFISNLENLPSFWDKVEKSERISGNGEVGSTYILEFKTLLDKRSIEVEVVEAADPSKFAFRNNSAAVKLITGFQLREIDGKNCEVTLYRDAGQGFVANILSFSFLINKSADKEFTKILKNLKEHLEKDLPVPQESEESQEK